MKYRLLRFSLLCILTMLCGGSIWADDLTGRTPEVTLDFTSNNWGLPEGSSNKQTTSTEYTNSSTNVKVTFAAADGYYYHTSGYVIFGKTNSTITLPAFDFDVDYISVEGRSGASGQVKQNIYVGDEAVSTETTGATGTNVYAIASDYQTAGKVYVLKVTSNANAQVTKINIYKKSGTQDNRAATTISFADGYATSGEPETSIALPTATVKTSDGATTISDAVITWESSDPTVAYIDGNNLSLLKYGKATITATYAGDETAYKGCTASYDVTVCGATQDGIFDFSLYNDYGSGYEYGSVTEQAGTWTSGNVALATAGRNCWYSDGTLRIYKPSSNASNNGKMTFSVPSDKAIKGIVINGSKIQHLTADVGDYSASSDNKTGTWTGNSKTVVLTLTGTDNATISTITVSYGNPNIDIAAPTFTPAAGNFYGAQNVTLSTTTDGATIKYSTDGETYSDYTGAIEVSATTTIQAYAEIDGEKSATVSATYTIRPNYTTIAQLHEDVTGDNTPIGFTPESVQVVYVNGKNGYLVDNEGNGVLVYNGGGLKVNGTTALAAGQVLTGGRIMGSLVSYQGSTEISGFTTDGTTITTADVTPVEKTLPLTSANQSTLVTIKGVTYNSTDKTFSDGTNTIAYYDKFSASPTLEDGKTYDVTGIAVKYDNYIQLCPRTAADVVEATVADPKLYILGVEDLNNNAYLWDIHSDLKEVTWDATNQVFTYELNAASTVYFCFADGGTELEDGDWDGFAAYRYAIGSGDNTPDLDTEIALQQGNGTIKLPAGQYVITVTADMKMTITAVASTDTYIVAGGYNGEYTTWADPLLTNRWSGTTTDNQMTESGGTYTKTYENVSLYKGTYEYKIVKNGSDWIGDPSNNGENFSYTINETGIYNVTFTFNPSDNTATMAATKQDGTVSIVVAGGFDDEEGGVDNPLFTTTWQASLAANALTEQADGTWTKTYSNVALSACTIKYKPVVNGSNWVGDDSNEGDNFTYAITEAGNYNVTFTFDPIARTASVQAEAAAQAPAAPTFKNGETAIAANSKTGFAGEYLLTIAGEEGTTIKYTIDDTDPATSETAKAYTEAVDLNTLIGTNDNIVVRAIALNGTTASEETKAEFYLQQLWIVPGTDTQLDKTTAIPFTYPSSRSYEPFFATIDVEAGYTFRIASYDGTSWSYNGDRRGDYKGIIKDGGGYTLSTDATDPSFVDHFTVTNGGKFNFYANYGGGYFDAVEVAAPTFKDQNEQATIESQEFTGSFKFTMVRKNQYTDVYYTTDGSDPTTESTLYDGVINVTKTTTFKAIGVVDGVVSDIATITLTNANEFRDIKANLTELQNLATGNNVYITVDAEGNIGTTDNADNAAAILKGGWHGTSYGWSNFTATVPVRGCVKITYATHDYGQDVIVTNSADEQVAKFNTKGAKWSSDPNNVVVAYYRTNSPTILFFSSVNYNPYFAVEAIDEADLPAEVTNYTVTYAAGEGTGVAPAAVEVEAGSKTTAPKNYSLYKEGYTLTGWSDGTTTYAPSDEITPEGDITLTAVYTQNEVSLADREDAVTITYALDGYNDNPKHNFQSGAGIIVTQATVNGKTIDVAVNTNGKFAHNGSGWHQVNANTTVTVPSCKGATFSVKTYNDANALTFGETAATAGATATYTATTDDATLVITQTANGYWNNLTITLPKVEQGGGETTVTGTIFSANVIATEAQNFNTGTTEITSEQATIEGGKMYAISAQTDAKALINAQGSTYYFSMTNNNTYFKVELDNALAVGDVITADGLGGVKSEAEKGLWITTSDGRPSSAPACSGTSATEGIVENILNYTVTEGDGYVGATELYIYRAVGATEYFGNFKITRPENDPNAVATPVITPATGTYTTAQEVSITCDTEGATIYYTTDGNDPTAESTQYTAAFTVSETTTVKAIAINGEYSSDIAESVITISDIQPGQSNLEWSYDAENPIPATSPDNGLYFSGYVNDAAGTNNGLHGVKLNGTGYAWFAKNPVEGKLTLTFGPRKGGSSAYAVDVYACTIDGTTATQGEKIGSISLAEAPGTGSLDIPANVTGIYIVRQTTSEGVLSKIVFKEKIARTFTDFEITNDEMKGTTYDGSTLPTGVTFSGTARGDSHGYGNVTLVVPTDGGAVKFTIGGCQYANPATFTVKNSDGETLATLDQKTPGCYHNGGTLTYFYNGDATTLTFGPMAYLPYFKAEAVDVEEVTVTFKDQNGTELGTKKVFEGETLGEIPFTEADLTIADGYKFRGWVYTSGVKVKSTDIVDGSKSVLASVTEIEAEPTAGTIQNYDLTSNIFYPEDHENFDVADAAYYNNHGWNFAAGGSFSVKVADKAQIVLKLCEYGNGTTITVTNAAGNTVATDVPAKAESGKDGATTTVNYDGGATTLTFTFAAQSYLHKVSVFNVNDFIEKDATSGYYIVPSGDAAGLVLAINAASSEADSKVFLPNGTYDLGTTALTTISGTNVSIIGESMEGVIIKNRPEIEGIAITATLLNTSTGLYMQDLTLDCEAPWGSNGANAERGVTLQDKGTQTICKNVYLKGRQDTYYCNNNGQYYFEDGKIEGTVDYICGNGDAYFQNVTLFCAEHHNPSTGDCVTAPNTKKEYGYVFNECTIDGVASQAGKYSLGRPWAVGTQVIYLHTKMNILPIEAGWTDWSPANAVQQFAEFHSYDPNNNDADVDLTKRKTDFNGVANSPVLTETQASAFKLSNVFGDWAPNQYTAQVQVEASTVKQLGNNLSWSAADGATMYAIVKNGSIIDLTDQTTYTIDDSQSGAKGLGTATDGDTATGDIYAVRAANARGGFGEAVKATVVDGIETIDADATINGTISEVYSTNGARLSAPQKGINIVKVRTANGTMKTYKVVIK